MQKKLTIKLKPAEAANESLIREFIARTESMPSSAITGYQLLKRSIDARGKQVFIQLTVNAFINEPFQEASFTPLLPVNVSKAPHSVVIVGAGPAGLFAALKLIESGIKPILLERGTDVRSRRRDLAKLNKEGDVNPDSNYCFGEGGAGTYSDGKLYTRSNKRGDINRILNILVQFGAGPQIRIDAHPHIGTNKLPHIITAIRHFILDCGGEFHFHKKLTGFTLQHNRITEVTTEDGDRFPAEAVLLATGHSARDIFRMLHRQNILIESKPFALGVRIEHPQSLIDSIQYHCPGRDPFLPPASYSLVQQVEQRGVFSFCMCPGGIIAPAATQNGELVVNGWSPSKRNNPFANSGMVVSVEARDYAKWEKEYGPLAAMAFQKDVEEKAWNSGGGHLKAPAQRMGDFCENKISATLPDCSYIPGLQSAPLKEVLPGFVYHSLQGAFREFGKKMRGYFTNEAIVVATESRTSSPVRIPRDAQRYCHPQIENLYPCGEGAGYAGGIVSAAMDGENLADVIAATLQ